MLDTALCTTAELWNQPRNPTAEGFISVNKGGKGRRKDEEGGRRREGERGGRKRGREAAAAFCLQTPHYSKSYHRNGRLDLFNPVFKLGTDGKARAPATTLSLMGEGQCHSLNLKSLSRIEHLVVLLGL